MLDVLGLIAMLQRPGLLVRTARLGVGHYDRARCLPRLVDAAPGARHGEIILRLLESEAEVNDLLRTGNANYRARHQVDLLTALLAEAGSLREALRLVA
jgi:hypothetical protein